jgi:Na+/alanine symporter
VAIAIAIGGPGAVFWMWVTALLGMSSAFIAARKTCYKCLKRCKAMLILTCCTTTFHDSDTLQEQSMNEQLNATLMSWVQFFNDPLWDFLVIFLLAVGIFYTLLMC